MQPKTIILIVFIIAIVFIMAIFGYFKATAGVSQGEEYAQIEITPDTFDFGEIDYGEIGKHTYQVKNLGQADLIIKKVATSCGCTTAEVSKEIIAPGQTAELIVSYDTGAMSGPHGMGDQERIIYVKTNDPINPQAEVTFTAYVK